MAAGGQADLAAELPLPDAHVSAALEQFSDSRNRLTRVLPGGEQRTTAEGASRGIPRSQTLGWLVPVQVVPQATQERFVASVSIVDSLEQFIVR